MRKNAKIDDDTLIALAIVGVTQGTIAKIFGCNQTAVSAKMKKLHLFAYGSKELEGIFLNLSSDEKEWYASKLVDTTVIDYIAKLIHEEYLRDTEE